MCSCEKPDEKVSFLPHQQTSSFSVLHFTHRSVSFNDDIQQFMRLTKQPKVYNNFHSVQQLGRGWLRIKLGWGRFTYSRRNHLAHRGR